MLKLARVLLLGLLLIFWFLFGLLLCLVRPRHPNNVYVFARMYHAVCPLIGLKVRVTVADEVKSVGPAVYVCNHQSNYDIFTVTGAVQPGVVAVGKKSLLWLPFFGLIFWLSGNVLIDRSNRSRAIGTIGQVVERIKNRGTSIWMFPEDPLQGTRPAAVQGGRLPYRSTGRGAGGAHRLLQLLRPDRSQPLGQRRGAAGSDGPGLQQGARCRRHSRPLRQLPCPDGGQAGRTGQPARSSPGRLSTPLIA